MLLSALVQGDDADTALVRSDGRTLTYAALREAAEIGGRALTVAGYGPGDVIAVAVADPSELLLAAMAVWKSGAAVLPLDARAGKALLVDPIERSGAAAVVTALKPDLTLELEKRDKAAPVDERTGIVLFTSGSSGKPKGVLLGRDGIVANVEAICGYLPLAQYGRTAVVLPLFYSYALVGQALTTLRTGGTLVLLSDQPFPKTQLELMAAQAVNGLSAVPTALRLLARTLPAISPRPQLSLGYVASAGGPLDAATVKDVREAFAPKHFFNQYGLTEASPRVTALSDAEAAFERGSVGKPLPGIEVKQAEDGQLLVRGPSVMLGYLGDEAATRAAMEADWLRTGDQGRVDAEGYVFITGRNDGIVKVAGERVGLDEVEAALRGAPGVEDLIVVAVPDEVLGSRLVALVVGADGGLRERARETLPAVKRPSKVLTVTALPKTANGKPDRAAALAEAKRRLGR